jgi:hypothetical protein
MDHSLTLSIALIWIISVYLWTGDLQSAERRAEWVISRATSHSLAPYLAVGRGFPGELAFVEAIPIRGSKHCKTLCTSSTQPLTSC